MHIGDYSSKATARILATAAGDIGASNRNGCEHHLPAHLRRQHNRPERDNGTATLQKPYAHQRYVDNPKAAAARGINVLCAACAKVGSSENTQ